MPFWDYVNRKESHIPSLYQFTQMVTWFFYQFFGGKAWPWHLLYVTLQAMNSYFLFRFCKQLFIDTGIRNASLISFAGSLLFCISPHISEVVIWEPSFHYLQGLLLILLILICAQQFIRTRRPVFAWFAGILFFLSTYSLEVFYLTPIFTILVCLYYHLAVADDKSIFKRCLIVFTLPQGILFAMHLIVLNAVYHSGIGHVGTTSVHASAESFSKPLKYIFHILFFGRYFTDDAKRQVYHFCESAWALTIFYAAIALLLSNIVFRFKKMEPKGKAIGILFLFVLFSTALLIPVWFPDSFVVIYDRYTYVIDAFAYVLLTLLISYIAIPALAVIVWASYTLGSLYFAHKVIKMWKVSGDIVNNLVYYFPNDPSKTVLILNVPECYYGVQMIGSREEGEFKILYNAVMPNKITNPVYEVSAYNITTPGDGAHVTVINDSTLHVTLNQWGTWWWWFGFGAGNFENEYYKLNMVDMGHWYELKLKRPANEYKLLYITGDQWRTVGMNRKNEDQY